MTVKFKYLIFMQDHMVMGTNDLDVATEAAEYEQVVDVETGLQIGPLLDEEYREVAEFVEVEQESVDPEEL